MHKEICRVKQNHKHNRSDQVEIKMDKRGPFCILFRSNRRNQGGYTSTDILSHDDRDRSPIRHRTSHTQRLQNTDRSRRALNDRSQNRTGQHTKHRIFEHQKDVCEFRHVCQRLHCSAHCLHTKHQNCKSDHDRTGIFFLVFPGKKKKTDTDDRKNRRKRRRLEHFNHKAVTL